MSPADLAATYANLRKSFAWRVVERDAILASGPDTRSWLQGQVTQDLDSLQPSGSIETLVLSPQGKVEGLCRVFLLAGGDFLLDTKKEFGRALFERLRRFKLRVRVELSVIGDLHVVELRGPACPSLAGMGEIASAAADWPSLSGYDLVFRGVGAATNKAMVGALGQPPGDDSAFLAARIEAGIPELGTELTERTIPQEAGDIVARTVSFSKGCYTGQELVARLDSRGSNVPRRLLGVTESAPGTGTAPLASDGLRQGDKLVGEVTSLAYSPRLGLHVGLAYVKRGVDVPSDVELVGAGGVHPGRISRLPLVGQ